VDDLSGRMPRIGLLVLVVLLACAVVGGAGGATASSPSPAAAVAALSCPAGYVDAQLSWGEKCLREGEFCKIGNPEYHAYGFDCPATGHLVDYAPSSTTTTTTTTTTATTIAATTTSDASVVLGVTTLLRLRTRTHGCLVGVLPDPRCSPGAYYSGLTTAVICSPSFHTSLIRNVSAAEKHAVELEYGLAPRAYGYTLEIDHIVPLELGGSNDIANLFPERASLSPGYRAKDRLENRLRAMVCAGQIGQHLVQLAVASNWVKLYATVFGFAPTR
jgi:hypothetical protein